MLSSRMCTSALYCTGGLCPLGLCPGGRFLSRGSLSRVVSVQGISVQGVSVRETISLHEQNHRKVKKHYVSTTSFAGTKNETRIPKMKIFKYPSLVLLHCTFTMYRPRVESISQWGSLCKQEMAAPPGHCITLQAINALKETISGLDMRSHRRSANLLF